MQHLARVFEDPGHTLTTIAAYPVESDRLMIAVDALDGSTRKAEASAILEVKLGKKLGVEVVHEVPVSSIDYLYEDGWHGLLRRDGIDQVSTFTKLPLGKEGEPRGIARANGVVYACGVDADGIDGFIGCVDGSTWKPLAKMSDGYEPGTFEQIVFGADGRGYACGSWGALFVGDANGWKPVKLPDSSFSVTPDDTSQRHSVRSMHAGTAGLLLAGEDFAGIYDGTSVQRIDGARDRKSAAVTECDGVEYWVLDSRMSDELQLRRRVGTKLVPHLKNKFKPIWWHPRPFSGLRMVTRSGRMTVSYGERIHMFDGKGWIQLKLQTGTSALVKRVPTGFK